MSEAGKSNRPWVAVLAIVLVILAIDSVRRMDYILTCTHNTNGLPLLLPAPDANSPTGYELNQRPLFLGVGGYDGYHFVLQTQQRIDEGAWRLRHVNYDNVPLTRELHWATLLSWLLEATAWCYSVVTGHSLTASCERVAPYAHTLFFVVILLTLVPLTARRFGSGAASTLALGLLFLRTIYEFHLVGNFDHHGLIATFSMLSLFFLLAGGAGWVRAESAPTSGSDLAAWLPKEAGAKRWFAASAISGGAALWVSCATQIPIFVGLGVGMLLGAIGSATADGPWRYEPRLWRWWARVGAVTSVFFYLLEYFPHEMGLRLEVNHPLYALAWLGGGEVMYQSARWMQQGRNVALVPMLSAFVLALAAMAAAPMVTRLYPESFLVQDRFIQLMTRYYVMEGRSLWSFVSESDALSNWIMLNCLPLVGLLEVWLLSRASIARPHRSLLYLALMPCLVMSAMTLYQVRWIGNGLSLWLVNFGVLLWVLHQAGLATPGRKALLGIFVFLVILPGFHLTLHEILLYARQRLTNTYEPYLAPFDVDHLVIRETAFRLRRRIGTEEAVVLAGPTDTTTLVFHGNLPGIGTLYWENLAGLKLSGAIYGAPSFDKALELIQSRHITHLVFFSFGQETTAFTRLDRGLKPDDPLPDDAFALNLVKEAPQYPPWLRPIFVPVPRHKLFADHKVLAFEVVPGQSAREAALRWAQFRQRVGRNEDAEKRFDDLLAKHPDDLAILVEKALVTFERTKTPAFQATMERLVKNLAQADSLALDDRVNLMRVLKRADRHDEARRQLVACLRMADELTMRRLEETALVDLLELAKKLDAEQVRPEIISLGRRLLGMEANRHNDVR